MAAALVGGAILSTTLQVLFDRMASKEVVNFIRGRKIPESLLKKLETSYLTLEAVLDDAEEKETTNLAVKKWLDELKDAVYDAEDLLDEIATDAWRCQVKAEFITSTSEVRNRISASFDRFVGKLESKITEVLDRLESLATQTNAIGLRKGAEGRSSQRLLTTSLVDPEIRIYGRDHDKEQIVNLLLNDAESSNHLGVIAIVGMGGLGKTTLAQDIYKDQRIVEHFSLKAWVCDPREYDVLKITKQINEAVTSQTYDGMDLSIIQNKLRENLMSKSFLLVLDDVWNLGGDAWELLKKPLKHGALGRKIIVTTRDESALSFMRPIEIYHLNKLSEKDCWLLFKDHAFEKGNSDAYPELEKIGEEIIKKCDGLPLAAKALGATLRDKKDKEEWYKILESKIWSLPDNENNVLPSLRLSYNYLPSYLKRCFAYCAIFPKGYAFKKEELVQLWMAEGFLQQVHENEEMEDVGDRYLLNLVSRSLLERSNSENLTFVMHGLYHDLAYFVSGRFYSRLEHENTNKITDKTRHFSYLKSDYDTPKKFEALYEASRLRTFISLELHKADEDKDFYLAKKVPHDLLLKLRCLRVLSLSHYCNVMKLPKSIGDLKHLRYLNFSYTKIEKLPNSICKLCNLQTLNLSGCKFLIKLPRNIRELISLRHLYICGTSIEDMPIKMGRLQGLMTLTKFVVGKDIGFQIGELGELSKIRGAIIISKLQNVINPTDALNANLRSKRHLEELKLEWDADATVSQSARDIFNNLQPHSKLKKLVINNYGGTSFPNWVGDDSFSNITVVHLNYCKNCLQLPSLGQLPSLQDLSLVGFDEVVIVGAEFYSSGASTITPFRSLEILKFKGMLKWEEWFPYDGENGVFQRLQVLRLKDCPKLRGSLPKHLPSLTTLNIRDCSQLKTSLPVAPAIRGLKLINCNDALLKELPPTLHKLTMGGFTDLEYLPEGPMDRNHSLEEITGVRLYTTLKNVVISDCTVLKLPMYRWYSFLETLETLDIIYSCNSLVSFRLDIFPKLYHLKIKGCSNIKSLSVSDGYRPIPIDLLSLEIENCPKFVDLSSGGMLAPNLSKLIVKNCRHLKSLPKNMGTHLPSLEYLEISDCPQLESFPEGGLPSNLIHFRIGDCEELISTRMDWGLQTLHSLKTLIFVNLDPDCQDVESFSFPSAKSKSETPTPPPRFPHSNPTDSLYPPDMSPLPSFLQTARTNDPYFNPDLDSSIFALNQSDCDSDSSAFSIFSSPSIPLFFPPSQSDCDSDSSEIYRYPSSIPRIYPPATARSEDDSDRSENNKKSVRNLFSTNRGSSASLEIRSLFPPYISGSEDDSDSSENNKKSVRNLFSTDRGSSASLGIRSLFPPYISGSEDDSDSSENNEIPMPNLFPSGGGSSENNEIMPNLSVPSSSQASSVESFPEVDLLPASLVNLGIVGFGNLRSLENKGFQHLTSLQHLFIVNCPKLEHLPEAGLPATMSLLQINKCPLVTKQWKRKKGKKWRKIARIPFIRMDDQEPKILARSTTY